MGLASASEWDVVSDGGRFGGGGEGAVGVGGDELGCSLSEERFVGCIVPDAVEFREDQVDQVSLSLVLWVEREREETVFKRVEVYVVVQVKSEYVRDFANHVNLQQQSSLCRYH